MLLQVEVSAEAFHAVGAEERLLVTVGVHVELKVGRMVKRLGTLHTLVAFLTAVCHLVVLVIPVLVESFPAYLTHVGFHT